MTETIDKPGCAQRCADRCASNDCCGGACNAVAQTLEMQPVTFGDFDPTLFDRGARMVYEQVAAAEGGDTEAFWAGAAHALRRLRQAKMACGRCQQSSPTTDDHCEPLFEIEGLVSEREVQRLEALS